MNHRARSANSFRRALVLLVRLGMGVATILLTTTLATAKVSEETVDLSQGVSIVLTPGTSYKKLSSRHLFLKDGKRVHVQAVVLTSGRIDGTVSEGSALLIHTSVGVHAMCTKGHMVVGQQGEKAMVANIEGDTFLVERNGLREVAAGTVKTREGAEQNERSLLPPPEQVKGPNVLVDRGQGTKIFGLKWARVPEAQGYRVLVTRSDQDATQELVVQDTTEPELSLSRAFEAGRYDIRVQSIDQVGLAGPPSLAHSVQVVGLVLPEGANVDEAGTVRLGMGQRVSFAHTASTFITYGRGGQFNNAPEQGVGLDSKHGVTVWFRAAGQPRPEASLRVAPRRIAADVEIGPKQASWPRDPLFISVKLRGASGQPAPDWIRPTARVLLGVDPINVDWKKAGNTLYATLPAEPKTQGPWVVRVEVEDQYGVVLGRGFLEVAKSRNAL